jgi:hypothetical protein
MTEPILHTNLAILQVEDAHIIEEIRTSIDLDGILIGKLSDTEYLVDPLRLKEFSVALRKMGMPALVRRYKPE